MGTEGESWASWSGILAQDQKLFGPVCLRTRHPVINPPDSSATEIAAVLKA